MQDTGDGRQKSSAGARVTNSVWRLSRPAAFSRKQGGGLAMTTVQVAFYRVLRLLEGESVGVRVDSDSVALGEFAGQEFGG